MEPFMMYPVLSTEQKLTVRELTHKLARARDNAAQMVKEAETNLMKGIETLALELGLKDIPSSFDIDTLVFTGK
jgi:hypothetical protein